MKTNTEKIKQLLTKLKKASDVYLDPKTTPEQKERIYNGCGFIFDELEELGCQRVFCESLLLFGKEFLDYEYVKKK